MTLRFLLFTGCFYVVLSQNCPNNKDQWPRNYCKEIIKQNINRCTTEGNINFKRYFCCKSCELSLKGDPHAGSNALWHGDMHKCVDKQSFTVCDAIVKGLSVWKCDGAGRVFCQNTCGLCQVTDYKTTFPCHSTSSCSNSNFTTACNANGASTYKCTISNGAVAGKCNCPSSPICDLTQNACKEDIDCSSDRTAVKPPKQGCRCNKTTNKCFQATCSVGKACPTDTAAAADPQTSPTPTMACSSDGLSEIPGSYCYAKKCVYYAPVCLPGKNCVKNNAPDHSRCMADGTDKAYKGCSCEQGVDQFNNKHFSCKNNGNSTVTCNTHQTGCNIDTDCSSDGVTILKGCACDNLGGSIKSCGVRKFCLTGRVCKINTDCMSDGTDGSVRLAACMCNKENKCAVKSMFGSNTTPVCLSGKLDCTDKISCNSDGGTGAKECGCNWVDQPYSKECGVPKCLVNKGCTGNLNCTSDKSDGSTMTTPCKCVNGKCQSGDTAPTTGVCLVDKMCQTEHDCGSDRTAVAGCKCTSGKCAPAAPPP